MLNWLLFQAAKPLGTVVTWLLFMSGGNMATVHVSSADILFKGERKSRARVEIMIAG